MDDLGPVNLQRRSSNLPSLQLCSSHPGSNPLSHGDAWWGESCLKGLARLAFQLQLPDELLVELQFRDKKVATY